MPSTLIHSFWFPFLLGGYTFTVITIFLHEEDFLPIHEKIYYAVLRPIIFPIEMLRGAFYKYKMKKYAKEQHLKHITENQEGTIE